MDQLIVNFRFVCLYDQLMWQREDLSRELEETKLRLQTVRTR